MGGRTHPTGSMMTSQTALDRLPLTYNLESTQNKMGGYRVSREKLNVSFQRVQAHSHYLYTHGRSLFENAVTQAASPPDVSTCQFPCINRQSSPQLSYSKAPETERSTTGSKRLSSAEMSFNRAKLLHAIRRCSTGKLHDQLEIGKGDAIKQHIQLLNDTLRVDIPDEDSVSGNIRQTPTTCFSEVVLVPLYAQMPRDAGRDNLTLSSQGSGEEVAMEDSAHGTEQVMNDRLREDEELDVQQDTEGVNDEDELFPEAGEEQEQEENKEEENRDEDVQSGVSENLTDPHHNISHHTWVDDVTVSSASNSEQLADDQLNGSAEEIPEHKRSKRLEVCTGAGADINPETLQEVQGLEVAAPVVMDLWDLQNNRKRLPGYICPNSVDKSKELAVQDWLHRTDFPNSCRELPLY